MNKIRNKIAKLSYKIFNMLENNGVSDFKTNGEDIFLDFIIKSYKGNDFIAFDVGANVGEYSKIILNMCVENNVNGGVHIFEPTRKCFQKLEEIFSKNEQVFLNNFGLSSQLKNSTIFYDKEKSGLASLYQRDLVEYDIKLNKKENINLEKASEYIKRSKISHINLVKIDVEGHEMEVLRGFEDYLNPSFIDFIQFEYGGCNIDSKLFLRDLYRFFEEKGFSVAKIMSKNLEVRNYKAYMENFVYSNYVAFAKESKNFNTEKNDYILW